VRCGLPRDFQGTELNALGIPETVRGFGSIVATHVEMRGVCDRYGREQAVESVNKDPREPRGEKRNNP
jgi:hypothetical protein